MFGKKVGDTGVLLALGVLTTVVLVASLAGVAVLAATEGTAHAHGAERSPAAEVAGEDDDTVDDVLRVITHNIAGGPKNQGSVAAIDEVRHQVRVWQPDVVMLQEVCWQQALAFVVEHPGWGVAYTPMQAAHPGCRGPQGQFLASPHPFTRLPDVPLHDSDERREFALLCATVDRPNSPVQACTVHLRAGTTADAVEARTRQIRRVHRVLGPAIDAGTKVVVAGDFNARLRRPEIDPMYRLATDHTFTGPGRFFEADQTDRRHGCRSAHGACRDGEPTIAVAPTKLDYIFFSNTLTTGYPGSLSSVVIPSQSSDHHLLRGSAVLRGPTSP